jgi:hypothetical protein
MNLSATILATVTASDELPELWNHVALGAFLLGALLSLMLLIASIVVRARRGWFHPCLILAFCASGFALAFFAYVYKIDYVAVGYDGTEASLPIWQALWVPSLPLLTSLIALVTYRIRNNNAELTHS